MMGGDRSKSTQALQMLAKDKRYLYIDARRARLIAPIQVWSVLLVTALLIPLFPLSSDL
jgi:hypothetical protein